MRRRRIGQLLIGMGGQTKQAAAETSVQLTKLAADASSIFNVSFAEATTKIAAALRGESEPISAFGIDLQEGVRSSKEAFRLRTGLDDPRPDHAGEGGGPDEPDHSRSEGRRGRPWRTRDRKAFANSSRAFRGARLTQRMLATVGQALSARRSRGWLGGLNQMAAATQAWVDTNKGMISAVGPKRFRAPSAASAVRSVYRSGRNPRPDLRVDRRSCSPNRG